MVDGPLETVVVVLGSMIISTGRVVLDAGSVEVRGGEPVIVEVGFKLVAVKVV